MISIDQLMISIYICIYSWPENPPAVVSSMIFPANHLHDQAGIFQPTRGYPDRKRQRKRWKTHIFDGLYHPFMVILGMVYDCFNHIRSCSWGKMKGFPHRFVNAYPRHSYHLIRKESNDYLARISHNAKNMTILDLSIVTHSFKYDRIPSGKLTVENGHLVR